MRRLNTWLILMFHVVFTHGATVPDYSRIFPVIESEIKKEMTDWGIGGVAVALVDGQNLVHSAGYGEAARDSVFRCGSISKLLNAVAVMQLVEKGLLDLDAPVDRYSRELLPVIPFEGTNRVTLRQLLCHRSGMIRESPVGGYLDGSQPGLIRTVGSVAQTVLVNPPNTKTRYSNVGPSIAGRIVELTAGMPYEQYQKEKVLGPMGMNRSYWSLKSMPKGRLIPSHMRIADGRGGFDHRLTPVFDLGTVPAGNLFTSVEDLGRFVAMLAARGDSPGGRLLKSETLEQMFAPQLVEGSNGFGLGFMVGSFSGHRCISHNGAVYGHSSSLMFLPESQLGVVVMGNEDIANARIQKIANRALSLMLEAKCGVKPQPLPKPIEMASEALAAFAGAYESQSYWAEIKLLGGRLVADISGQPTKLTPVDSRRFLADSRINDAVPVNFESDAHGRVIGFTMGAQVFSRVPENPPPMPQEWSRYLGAYGSWFIPVVISVRHGHLYAMTENMVDYRLKPLNRHVFQLPPGMYVDEQVVFLPDRAGKPHAINFANMILKRH